MTEARNAALTWHVRSLPPERTFLDSGTNEPNFRKSPSCNDKDCYSIELPSAPHTRTKAARRHSHLLIDVLPTCGITTAVHIETLTHLALSIAYPYNHLSTPVMSLPAHNLNSETSPPSPFVFDPVHEAIDAIARGEFVVVMDDESRENEGDLICAAEKVTTEGMAWMIRWTRWVSLLEHLSIQVHFVLSLALLRPVSDHT